MKIAFVSLEGVLAPDIWNHIAKIANIPGLVRPDDDPRHFAEVTQHRVNLLKDHRLTFDDLHFIVSMFDPFKGAAAFLKGLQRHYRVVMVSDSFAEVALHFGRALGNVELKCPLLRTDDARDFGQCEILPGYTKEELVQFYHASGYETMAIGSTVHDLGMLRRSTDRFLFRPSPSARQLAPGVQIVSEYKEILSSLSISPLHLFPVGSLASKRITETAC
jgi:phosphoserine/homoserine phosphotransferase